MIVFFTYGVSLQTWVERGIASRETDVYRRLLPRLGQVTFLTYGPGDAALEPSLRGIRVLPRPARLGVAAASLLAPWVYRREMRAAAVFKTNQASGAWTAVIAKRLFGKPLIVRCGYPWSFNSGRESTRRWRRPLVRWLERLALRAADRVVVTSAGAAEYLVRLHGVDRGRLRMVANAIDVDRFAPDPAVAPETGLVTFVGRLSREKNLETLVQAVGRVPAARLRLIGDGPERGALARSAAQTGARVEFTGVEPNERLPGLLNRTHIFALPSHYEGQPKSLLEAMSCGRPVIGADVPGIREIVRHGDTGWLCAPDADHLAQAIGRLLEDPGLCVRLGRAARADVERRHSVDAIAESELAVIGELLGPTPSTERCR